jgi:hypothetical protein
VISLGPEQIEVKSSDTVMVVRDKPLIVRGKLPPIVDGALEQPRGLLIGTPDGLTFEYRTDDVRLLGVRQGDFVDRKDWGGRGGDALQPLGKVVLSFVASSEPSFALGRAMTEPRALRARLIHTWTRGAEAGLAYDVVDPLSQGADAAALRVEETPRGITCSLGAGFERRFDIVGLRAAEKIWMRCDQRSAETRADRTETDLASLLTAWYRRVGPGTYDLTVVRVTGLKGVGVGANEVVLTLGAGERTRIELRHLPRVSLPEKPGSIRDAPPIPTGWETAFK